MCMLRTSRKASQPNMLYQLNGKDESHWLLGRFVAWHRYMDRQLAPGQMTVLEVNAVSELFSEGKPIAVTLMDRTWTPAVRASFRLWKRTKLASHQSSLPKIFKDIISLPICWRR